MAQCACQLAPVDLLSQMLGVLEAGLAARARARSQSDQLIHGRAAGASAWPSPVPHRELLGLGVQ